MHEIHNNLQIKITIILRRYIRTYVRSYTYIDYNFSNANYVYTTLHEFTCITTNM